MFPEVTLVAPTREDVQRLSDWLDDPDVNAVWFGVDDDGKPLHATYAPETIPRQRDPISPVKTVRIYGDDQREPNTGFGGEYVGSDHGRRR